MTTSAERVRAWQGPAILSFGFRPFFLLGALWAALAMLLWIFMLTGRDVLPTSFDAVSWHAHEMLFGYLGAVMAGFLLTAVPNWTGQLPVTGWPLSGLAIFWVIGRGAVAVSAHLPWAIVALADLALPLALAGFLAREIVAGRNWRNLPVFGLLTLWTLANAVFHLEAARGEYAADGLGLRIGLAAAVMMIALIGGRIVPSFTRNWLSKRGATRLPTPFGRADGFILVLTFTALSIWVIWPDQGVAAFICGLAGGAHLWRMSRWQGLQTGAEALVWVLHAGYAMVPLGFLAVIAIWLFPDLGAAPRHIWLAGATGLMTLAVMSRASLGHAGLPLHAGPGITALYIALIIAIAARVAAGLWPDGTWLLHLAAAAWIVAFAGFAILYWPILARPRGALRSPEKGGR